MEMISNDSVYLLIAVIVCITTWWLSKTDEHIDWLLRRSQSIPKHVSTGISSLAAVSLLLLLADEIGLFFEEWGYSSGPLGYTRWVMGLPGITHFLYLMNLALLAPALWEFLNIHYYEYDSEKIDNKIIKRFSATFVLTFIIITLLITGMQLLFWGEVSDLAGILIVVIVGISMLKIGNSLTKYQMQTKGKEPIDAVRRLNTYFLLFGMTLLQTMITKAGLLLVLIPYTRDRILGFVSDLLKFHHNIKP